MQGVVIAGTHSGCGKTTVTLGILSALKKKGLSVQSFKTGPDFIDAGLHRLITGRTSRNLDLWMCGEDYVRECFDKYSSDADISVVEGVMGLYDGKLSTASLAKALNLPVILVVDAYGMAESAGALIMGFKEYSAKEQKGNSTKETPPYSSPCQGEDGRDGTSALLRFCTFFAGVIFNRVGSENHFNRLKDSVRDVPVLGYLPRDLNFEIPHRHLGLTVAEEEPISGQTIQKLADVVLKYVDVDAIVQKSKRSKEQKSKKAKETPPYSSPCQGEDGRGGTSALLRSCTFALKIAVAYDRAFCFYYEDNLDLLKEAGAEIVLFSPLSDSKIPDDIDAVYIGGGYPELYAKQLSGNKSMLESVRHFANEEKPVYAECGGFMYLTEGIYDFDDVFYPMAGTFPLRTKMTKGRAKLGYREVVLKHGSVLGEAGMTFRGHEFHYSEIVKDSAEVQKCRSAEETPPYSSPCQGEEGRGVSLIYSVKDGSGSSISDEGYLIKNTLGSYVHIHFGSNHSVAENFIKHCKGVSWK